MRRIRLVAAAVLLAAGLLACEGGQGPTQPDVDPEAEEQDGMPEEQDESAPEPDDPSPQTGETDEFGEDP